MINLIMNKMWKWLDYQLWVNFVINLESKNAVILLTMVVTNQLMKN